MNAVPPAFAAAPERRADSAAPPAGRVAERWAALHAAAAIVAQLARSAPAAEPVDLRPLLESADPARLQCVRRGVDDLAAVLETGIAALLAASARRADPRPAALALWREFEAARGAVLALLGPRRS